LNQALTVQFVGYWNVYFAVGDIPDKHCAVSEFFKLAPRMWWIFIMRGRVLSDKLVSKDGGVTFTFSPTYFLISCKTVKVKQQVESFF